MDYYKGFNKDMILRDYLAYDRTRLALMRTVLAFVRTALGLLATGLGLIILQESFALRLLGFAILATAAAVFIYGLFYWRRFSRRLGAISDGKAVKIHGN